MLQISSLVRKKIQFSAENVQLTADKNQYSFKKIYLVP